MKAVTTEAPVARVTGELTYSILGRDSKLDSSVSCGIQTLHLGLKGR